MSVSIDLAAFLKQEWLVREYVDVVSSVEFVGSARSAKSGSVAQASSLHKRGRGSADTASLACTAQTPPKAKKRFGVEVATRPRASACTSGLI